jgi:hypothetical protein
MKDFDTKELIVGFTAIALLAVGCVWVTLGIYKWVGQSATNILCLMSIVMIVYTEWRMRKNPMELRKYLHDLHKSLWAHKHAYRIRAFMCLMNISALFSLALLGWWFAFFTGLCLSVVLIKRIREAQMVHWREGTTA